VIHKYHTYESNYGEKYELVTGYFDFFAVPEPRDRIVLGVLHLALHLGGFALHHAQVLQRLLDDHIRYDGNNE